MADGRSRSTPPRRNATQMPKSARRVNIVRQIFLKKHTLPLYELGAGDRHPRRGDPCLDDGTLCLFRRTGRHLARSPLLERHNPLLAAIAEALANGVPT